MCKHDFWSGLLPYSLVFCFVCLPIGDTSGRVRDKRASVQAGKAGPYAVAAACLLALLALPALLAELAVLAVLASLIIFDFCDEFIYPILVILTPRSTRTLWYSVLVYTCILVSYVRVHEYSVRT